MSSTYLIHHGIKGQKWGVRRFQTKLGSLTSAGKKRYANVKESLSGNKYDRRNRKIQKDIDSFKKHKNGMYDKKGNQLLSKEDVQSSIKALEKKQEINSAKSAKIQAKQVRKKAIKSTYKTINKTATKKDKFIYNNATRKLAAKYVVDKKMTLEEANKKAKSKANRNTAIFVATYAGVMAYNIYKSK